MKPILHDVRGDHLSKMEDILGSSIGVTLQSIVDKILDKKISFVCIDSIQDYQPTLRYFPRNEIFGDINREKVSRFYRVLGCDYDFGISPVANASEILFIYGWNVVNFSVYADKDSSSLLISKEFPKVRANWYSPKKNQTSYFSGYLGIDQKIIPVFKDELVLR